MEINIANTLRELREKFGLTYQDIANDVGVSKQSIYKFESGLIKPSSETLLKLAEFYNISYSSFFENPSKFKIEFSDIKFREQHKIYNDNLENEVKEEVCKYLSRFIEIETILKEKIDFENPLSGLEISNDKDVEKAAKILRKKWKIGNAPISDVVETIESKGVYVIEVCRFEDFSGLSGKANEVIPIIVLNANCPNIERKRFTALHELGHIVLEFCERISDTKVEYLCNVFAGAVLLVDEVIFNELGKNRTNISLTELKLIKERYGISIQAIIIRAKNVCLIDEKTSKEWWRLYSEWTSTETSNSFGEFKSIEKPSRFKRMIVKGVTEKRISMSKAAELTSKKIDILRKELDELNFIVK